MYTFVKSLLDTVFAFCLLVLLIPVFLLVALGLAISLKGNPFFFQDRVGKGSRIFRLVKFRTMSNQRDENGKLLPDKLRVTKIGQWTRGLSLDELPQLWNVLKGDMSVVGPRPLLVKYLPLYSPEQARRHEVKPGITGWAQVNGRNSITWEQKFTLDVWYVDHIGFLLDLKIIWMTFLKVVNRQGIDADGQTTMQPFTGNQNK